MNTPMTKRFDTLLNNFTPWQDKFAIEIDQLKHIQKIYEDKVARFDKDEQTLNIAIMGQVKAGKSSFLNALLFDGKPILPEAATPKTANLTRISYGDTHRLEVEFYNQADWQRITTLADSDANNQEARVAKEQVAMIEQTGIDPIATITKGNYVQQADSLDDIMQVLNDYAGNDGRYTGLVKMIRLYLPLKELAGYNIIDTPGMNDPVVSRTQRTKEEMASSDVVFFLSRASNFLDSTDTDLLSKQLPEAGIKRLVLIAGQYDSAIEQDGYDRDSLAATEANLHKRIIGRAQIDLSKLADLKQKAGQSQVAELLKTITTPVFSSTYAYGYAHWDKSRWNASMTHTYQQLSELAEDEWDYQFSHADWERIGGFSTLINAYEAAKADKTLIIEEQKQALLPDALQNLNNWLDDVKEQIHQRILTLKSSDIADLDRKQTLYQHKINNVVNNLEQVISQVISKAKDEQKQVSRDLRQGIQENSQLKTRSGTTTEKESYEVSTSKWYKPWTWGETETHYRTRTINYEYVSVTDVIDQITGFAYECMSDIEYHFDKMISPDVIKANLRQSLLASLDTDSADFDPAQFRNLLNQAISRIHIPTLDLDIGDAGSSISRNFGSEITSSSDRAALKLQLQTALRQVFSDLNEEFGIAVNDMITSLTQVKEGLAESLTQSMKNELAQLREDMHNQQSVIQSYCDLITLLDYEMTGSPTVAC